MGLLEQKSMGWNEKRGTFLGCLHKRFVAQKARCDNPNNAKYPWYGAKGILVEYSWSDFLSWFKNNLKNYKGHWSEFSVGRIDHDKGYSLNNLKLETIWENTY